MAQRSAWGQPSWSVVVRRDGGGGGGPAHPSTRLVVLQVHKHPALLLRSLGEVLLPLLGIHKLLSKPVAVLHIIPTAAPQPVPGKVLGSCCPAAATRGQLTLSARPADGVHHPRSTHGIGEGRLPAPCKTRPERWSTLQWRLSFSLPLQTHNTPRKGTDVRRECLSLPR